MMPNGIDATFLACKVVKLSCLRTKSIKSVRRFGQPRSLIAARLAVMFRPGPNAPVWAQGIQPAAIVIVRWGVAKW